MAILLTLVLALPALAAAQTPGPVEKLPSADEIIAKNIEAHGGMAKLKAIKSIRMTGKMTVGPGIEIPIIMEAKRPNLSRLEGTFQGMTFVQAYDGKGGWQIMPFQGVKDPAPMSPEESKDAEEQSDMDGPLVDYKEKGHTVEVVGKETIEGAPCYKLKVTLKNGDVRFYFIDIDSGLEIRTEGKRKIQGNEMEVEQSIGDYKEVAGVMMPHSMDGGPKGSPNRQKILIDMVEVNPEIDDARFKMPPPAPKPAEKPAEKPPTR
jgi:outer membrane lipoprotein-sorting protein